MAAAPGLIFVSYYVVVVDAAVEVCFDCWSMRQGRKKNKNKNRHVFVLWPLRVRLLYTSIDKHRNGGCLRFLCFSRLLHLIFFLNFHFGRIKSACRGGGAIA